MPFRDLIALQQHGPKRVVATPEMVVKRCGGVKRDQAEKEETNCLVCLMKPLRERIVAAAQSRQLHDEAQLHPVAIRIGMEEPEDRLYR